MGTVRLACDRPHCGAVRQATLGESIAELRKRLTDVGWLTFIHTDISHDGRRHNVVRDYCPPCAGRGSRALAAEIASVHAGATR